MERVRHFEILDTLGQGGFATVFRARDTRLGREVALKRLRPDVASSPNARRRILQEGRAIAKLSHPGIVALHDIVPSRAGLVLVMELVPGQTLARRLAQGALGTRQAAALGRDVARALAHAHDKGVIHRDLKPSNLLLTPSGDIKVTDFGLARFVTEASVLAVDSPEPPSSDSVVGTPLYMSPEQVRGVPADARSDVFSLCSVLFEAACGHRAFRGTSFYEVATAVLHAEPDWKRAADHGLEPGLAAVLDRGMAKEPSARYADMAALARELDGLLSSPRPAAAGRVDPAPAIVGRRAELERLRAALEEIAGPGGRGRTIVIAGEAGIGKTALVEEVTRLHRSGSGLPTASVSFREGRAGYRPIADALGALIRGVSGGAPSTVLSRLEAEPDGKTAIRFPELVDAVFAQLAGAGPFLLVIENLHDAGPDAIEALRVAASAAPSTKGLLLLTYRPEERLATGQGSLRSFLVWARAERLAEEMVLERFRAEETAELLGRLLPEARRADEWFIERIQAETEGNPLFVRETARLWLNSTAGADGEDGKAPIPGRVRDVLARRLEAVDVQLLRVLEAAAIEGEVFHSDTIADMLGTGRAQALEAIQLLVQDHHVVVPSGKEYRFTHAKFREVVTDRILPELRAELHLRIAERLRHQAVFEPADVARHLVAAGRLKDALPFLVPAARKALKHGATAEARSLYAAAAEVFASLGAPATRDHLETLIELGRLQRLAGRRDVAADLFSRARQLAILDLRSQGLATYELGWLRLNAGDLVEARRLLEQARDCLEKAGDRVRVAACLDGLGVVRRHEGRLDEALRKTQAAFQQLRRARYAWGVALSQSNLAAIHFAAGNPARSLECVEAACRYFRRQTQRPEGRQRLAGVLGNLGVVCASLGQLERAIEAHAENLSLKRAIGDRAREPLGLVNLADAQAAAGLRTAAGDAYARAARLAAAAGDRAVRADALRGLAMLERTGGAPDAAVPLLNESLREARAAHDVEAEARATLEMAEARLAGAQADAAEAALTEAASLARKGGLGDLLARTEYLEGRIRAAQGKRAGALAAYRKALQALRRRPQPDLRWRVLRDLAALLEDSPRGRAEAGRNRAQARKVVADLAHAIADPALRRAFESDPERAAVLGLRASGSPIGPATGEFRYDVTRPLTPSGAGSNPTV